MFISKRMCHVRIFSSILFLQIGCEKEKSESVVTQKNIKSEYPFFDLYFVDNQTGWVVEGKGTVLHTTDGGVNWQMNRIQMEGQGYEHDFKCVFFFDRQYG